MPRLLAFVPTAALAALFASPAAAQPAPAPSSKTRQYVVKPGDTCIGIARRELGGPQNYRAIPECKTPRRLQPGTIIELPGSIEDIENIVGADDSDAVLTSKRGVVRVREPVKPDWDPAEEGMGLYRAWRVNSRKRSTAELTFRDTSKLNMRENTVVIIYGPSRRSARRTTTRAELERGALRARLGELSGRRLVVDTPSSEASLRSGSALVTVGPKGTSRIANHRGTPVAVRGKRKKRPVRRGRVAVKEGFGSKVEVGKAPTPPRALPAAPVWQRRDLAGLGTAATGVSVSGEWAAVADAAAYQVEIARDETMGDVVASVRVPATITRFEAHRLPPGEYFARVAAIDGDEFESAPSTAARIEALALALPTPGAPLGDTAAAAAGDGAAGDAPAADGDGASGADEGPDVSKPAELAPVPSGTAVPVPDGATCALGEGAASTAPLELAGPGVVTIRCTTRSGQVATLEVPVAAPPVPPSVAVTSDAGRDRPLARGVTTVVDLAVRGDTGPLDALDVRAAGADIAVRVAETTAGGLRVEIQPGPKAPDATELELVRKEAPTEVLARAPLAVAAAAPTPAEPAPAPTAKSAAGGDRWKSWVGVFAAGALWPQRHNFGNTGDRDFQVFVGGGGGLRGGLALGPVWLEVEAMAAQLSYNASSEGSATQLAGRGHLGIAMSAGRSVDLFLLAGAGGNALVGTDGSAEADLDWEYHWGAGAAIRATDTVQVRIDGRHVLSAGETEGLANSVEALVGVQFRLDRWLSW